MQDIGVPGLPLESDHVFPTGFDDFQTETAGQFDTFNEDQQIEPDQQISRDNELLGFRPPTYNFTLLDVSLRRISLNLNARLHGMFFVADAPTTPTFNAQSTFPELTCYRRNLFQVTGSITLPRNLRYILTEIGDRLPILGQELQIAATESVENGHVKLISVPWKTPVGNTTGMPEEKSEKEPSSIPLDIMSNQDMDAEFATFPIAWKRLQFRIATANNGRRRELQQHFVVRLRLVITLPNGAKIPVAEARSAAIIVRGRSPRNFLSKKETPVSGEKGTNRKGTHNGAGVHRSSTGESAKVHLKRETSNEIIPLTTGQYDLTRTESVKSSSPFPDDFRGYGDVSTPNIPTPTLPSSKSPMPMHSPLPLPQPLSLTDDHEYKKSTTSHPFKAARHSSKSARMNPYKRPSLPSLSSTKAFLSSQAGQKLSSASLDSADLLYEYFPLSNDDWQTPVDAVYRPHVVHHVSKDTNAPQRPGIGGRNKRYFSSEGRERTTSQV